MQEIRSVIKDVLDSGRLLDGWSLFFHWCFSAWSIDHQGAQHVGISQKSFACLFSSKRQAGKKGIKSYITKTSWSLQTYQVASQWVQKSVKCNMTNWFPNLSSFLLSSWHGLANRVLPFDLFSSFLEDPRMCTSLYVIPLMLLLAHFGKCAYSLITFRKLVQSLLCNYASLQYHLDDLGWSITKVDKK